MEVIFMLMMFLLFVGISLNDVTGDQRWSRLLNERGVVLLIVFWTLTGFVLKIHFSTFTMLYSGPEAVLEPLWGFKNVGMATVPILLLVGSTYVKNRARSFSIICLELGLWLFILFCAKGNYSWGYNPSVYYLMYDYLALFLRFLLLLHLLKVREHRFSLAWLLAHVMISCKIGFFSNSCF